MPVDSINCSEEPICLCTQSIVGSALEFYEYIPCEFLIDILFLILSVILFPEYHMTNKRYVTCMLVFSCWKESGFKVQEILTYISYKPILKLISSLLLNYLKLNLEMIHLRVQTTGNISIKTIKST